MVYQYNNRRLFAFAQGRRGVLRRLDGAPHHHHKKVRKGVLEDGGVLDAMRDGTQRDVHHDHDGDDSDGNGEESGSVPARRWWLRRRGMDDHKEKGEGASRRGDGNGPG